MSSHDKNDSSHFYSKGGFWITLILGLVSVFLSIWVLPNDKKEQLGAFLFYGLRIILICAAVIFLLWSSRLYKRYDKKRVVIFYPKSNQDGNYAFWYLFLDHFIQKVNDNGKYWVSPCPINFYEQNSEVTASNIKSVFQKRDFIGAVISSPNNNDKPIVDLIVDLAKHKNNIILHDIPHPLNSKDNLLVKAFSSLDIAMPPIVSIDNREGGKQAAEILFDALKKKNKETSFKIYILHGNINHQHSVFRVNGFMEKMRELANHDVSIAEFPFDGNWSRAETKNRLKNWLKNNPNEKIDGIFACNDDMALGICDCIAEINSEGSNHSLSDILIVGFDNTSQMTQASQNNKCIIGTIDVNINLQADRTAKEIIKMIESNSNNQNYFEQPIKPSKIIF